MTKRKQDTLIDLVDYALSKRQATDPSVVSIVDSFEQCYRASRIPDYISFDAIGESGIPRLVDVFTSFRPPNSTLRHPRFVGHRRATVNDMYHVLDYLKAPEFNRSLLTQTRHDAVVDAIVSYILSWDAESTRRFVELYPEYGALIEDLEFERDRDDGAYVYRLDGNIPYIKTSIKVLRRHFQPAELSSINVRGTFQLIDYLDRDFVSHLEELYCKLRSESSTLEYVRDVLEAPMSIPFDIEDSIGSYETIKAEAKVKFITGQACSGKTTLLNSLKRYGWRIVSRGDIGSFSGKANNPVAVACLHASVEWALSHSDVLGDRGNIDNPLWVGIMQLCDPRYEETLVLELLKFLNANLNEPSIAYFMGQKAAVFIDPYPSICAKRMIARATDGDPYRGRLSAYAITQAIAYYTVARFFGWRVFCVPYTSSKEFDPQQYKRISAQLIKYFGTPDSSRAIPRPRYSKPSNNFALDNEFAKSVGIFK